jgi:hypothetical protein
VHRDTDSDMRAAAEAGSGLQEACCMLQALHSVCCIPPMG